VEFKHAKAPIGLLLAAIDALKFGVDDLLLLGYFLKNRWPLLATLEDKKDKI